MMKLIKTILLFSAFALACSCSEQDKTEDKSIHGTPSEITVEEKATVDSVINDLDKSTKELKKESEELKELVNDL